MDILTEGEIDAINNSSKLVKNTAAVVDRESAYEMLQKRLPRSMKA
jgi:hypothetical protein